MTIRLLAAATALLLGWSQGLRAQTVGAEADPFSIAAVRPAMSAAQAIIALKQSFKYAVLLHQVDCPDRPGFAKECSQLHFQSDTIFFTQAESPDKTGEPYINHIFYDFADSRYRLSYSIDLNRAAKEDAPQTETVYRVRLIALGRRDTAPSFVATDFGRRIYDKLGRPTAGNAWCQSVIDNHCDPARPSLTLRLAANPGWPIKAILDLYDPRYAPSAVRDDDGMLLPMEGFQRTSVADRF
jgi:hypothetical protein